MANNNQNVLTNQGGSLIEQTEEQYKKLMRTPGQQPLSSAGAAAMGASPDQSKRVGTEAQKQAAARVNMAPTQTAQQATRTTPQPQQQLPTQQAAKEKADRIRQLGTLGTRVEGLIQQRLDQLEASKAQVQVNNDAINALPSTQRDAARKALTDYLQVSATGNAAKQQAALKQLSSLLGVDALTSDGIKNYYQGSDVLSGMAGTAPTQ